MKMYMRLWQVTAVLALLALGAVLFYKWPGMNTTQDIPRAVNLPPVGYSIMTYDDLPGWRADNHEKALAPFLRSCAALMAREASARANPVEYLGDDLPVSFAGTVADWRDACSAAARLQASPALDLNTARQFFETHFVPVQISQPDLVAEGGPRMTRDGLFTGYFEPIFPAASQPGDQYTAPVLTRPDDLVTVDLGQFRPDMAGTLIAGRVQGGSLVPYDTHAQINRDRPDTEVLAWMNPNDLLFMQIQGSGRLSLDGETMRVGYAAPNGHTYTAIGRELVEMGEIPLDRITMQSIYEWLEAATPAEAARVREVNESYIFFRRLNTLPDSGLGPLGAQGVQLTAGRSLALDRRYHAMGVPVWVDLEEDTDHPYKLRKLFIAQDTGGAIRGPVRGDIYIGSGSEAGGEAGRMRRKGTLYTLLPRAVAERLRGDGAQETTADA